VGCTQTPTLQEGPDAEVSYDGLVRLNHSSMSHAWLRPDTDFSHYSKIVLGKAKFKFRSVTGNSRSRGTREFPIDDASRQRLVETAGRIFRDELSKSKHFTIVEERGPDVLVLTGALVDIVSNTPPEPMGRDTIVIQRFGEATLVLELFDSMSGETLARAIDRRAADSGSTARQVSSVTTWAEVQRMLRRWARILRDGLDGFHDV
jgi:hypothetical protein